MRASPTPLSTHQPISSLGRGASARDRSSSIESVSPGSRKKLAKGPHSPFAASSISRAVARYSPTRAYDGGGSSPG